MCIYTPHAQICPLKHIYTQHILQILILDKREEKKNLKPTNRDFVPSLYTFAFNGTREGETGEKEKRRQEDRT